VRGIEVVQRLGGTPAARRSPRGAAPALEHLVHSVGRGALDPIQLLVKNGQLFVELALSLRKFVESRLSLGVSGAVTRCQLRVRAARGRCYADVALARGVVPPHGRCPPDHRRAGGGVGRAQVVDIGRHRVVWEAGLSAGVHRGVPFHELPQASSSAPLA
jgi:hypothetical protein